VNSNIADAINQLPEGIKSSKEAINETIQNNVRQKIIKEHLIDPAYFEEMSKLLETIIAELKDQKINYEQYLQRMADLANRVVNPQRTGLPKTIQTSAQRALYNNLHQDEAITLACDEAVRYNRLTDWRGNEAAERHIKGELYKVLQSIDEVERIFPIIKEQKEY
jgi:type I restriction enzyme R subunit